MIRSSVRRVGRILVLAGPALALAGCSCCPPRPCCEPACASESTLPPTIAAAPSAVPQILIGIDVFLDSGGMDPSALATVPFVGGHALLTKVPAEELRARLFVERGLTTLALPKILSEAGQSASISLGETIGPDTPGSDNWTGTRASLTPVLAKDRSGVTLDIALAHRIAVRKDHAPDLAAIRASELRFHVGTLSIPSGATSVLTTAFVADPAHPRLIVLVSASVVTADELGRPVVASSAAAPIESAPLPIADRVDALAARLTLSSQNQPLHEVLKSIAMNANLNMAVSPDVKNVPVTLEVKDQDIASILTALGTDRFVWKLEDFGVVRISGFPAK